MDASFLEGVVSSKRHWHEPSAQVKGVSPAYRWTGPGTYGPVNLLYLVQLVSGTHAPATNKELGRYARKLAFGRVSVKAEKP